MLAPLMVVVFAILDYALWQVFVAIAGGYAILWMFLIIVVEIAGIAKLLNS